MLVLRKNRDFNNLPTMESFVNDFFGNSFLNSFNTNSDKVNITEDENSYSIELALPGYTKEDVNVELKDGLISISSKIEKENEEKNDNYIKREFKKSSFERSFYLPDDVDDEKIEASMENGVLSVTLSKIKELEDKTNIKKIDIK